MVIMGLFLGGQSLVAQSDRILTYDSIRVMLIREDFSAWERCLQSCRTGDLILGDVPSELKVAILPIEERPAWAQVPDSVMWKWMYSGFLSMERQRGAFKMHEGEISPEKAREKLIYHKHKWWIRGAVGVWVVALLLGVAAWGLRRQVKKMTVFDAGDWQSISDEILSPQANPNIWEDWRAFLNLSQTVQEFGEKWNRLSPSEKEVAEFLIQHLPVSQIAKRMACSQSYVYNLRSSIRRKWGLDPEEDLIRAILAERKGKL